VPRVHLVVNGAVLELEAPASIASVVARLCVRGRYAVEVNGEIVPRSAHAAHRLGDGDHVEVVQAIGGG
jgi:sulfur carrier protein